MIIVVEIINIDHQSTLNFNGIGLSLQFALAIEIVYACSQLRRIVGSKLLTVALCLHFISG